MLKQLKQLKVTKTMFRIVFARKCVQIAWNNGKKSFIGFHSLSVNVPCGL